MTRSEIARAIRVLVGARAPKTICPSEVARALESDEEAWRALMPAVREVAAGMADIVATQKGVPVDPVTARGPIRLALRAERKGAGA